MSSTHRVSMGDGYYVIEQHCEHKGCDVFLGTNYPDEYCPEHKQPVTVFDHTRTLEHITTVCGTCQDTCTVPNKGLGRASLAAWKTRHQHRNEEG